MKKGFNLSAITTAAMLAVAPADKVRAEEPEKPNLPDTPEQVDEVLGNQGEPGAPGEPGEAGDEPENSPEVVGHTQVYEMPPVIGTNGKPETVGTSTKLWFQLHFTVHNDGTKVGCIKLPVESLTGVASVKLAVRPNGPVPGAPAAGDILVEGSDPEGDGSYVFANQTLDAGDYSVFIEYTNNGADRTYARGDEDNDTSTPSGAITDGPVTSYNGFTNNIHVVPFAFELAEQNETTPNPPAPTLTPATDTGFSNTDGITNNPTPEITGTWEAGDKVDLYIDGVLQSSTTVTQNGQGIATPALPDGAHTITATVNDGAMSSPTVITVDTVAPDAPPAPVLAASSDTGTPGDGQTVDVKPTFEGDPDSNGLLHLYVDGEIVASVVTSGAVTQAKPDNGIAPNPYQASTAALRHEDAAGNMSPMSEGTEFKIVELPIEIAPGENQVVITLPETAPGQTYRLMHSENLKDWSETGLTVEGDGGSQAFNYSLDQGSGAGSVRAGFFKVVY